jgi:glycosyltransferase involved in cell wall biosynthesis
LPKIKIFSSHPVQYHVPFFREIPGAGWDIEVGYYHQGTAGRVSHDIGFGIDMAWDIDLLSGYPNRIFIKDVSNYQILEQLKVAPQLLTWSLKDKKTPLLLMGWFAEMTWLIWFLRIILKAPVIVMCETTPLSFTATGKPGWRTFILSWLIRHTTVNLFIGSRNKAFLIERGARMERLFPVPYSIDNFRFATKANRLLPKRCELCCKYGLDPELPTYLFCGKFINKKRPLQLLDAYVSADLAEGAQLLYVGEGELRQQLELRIQAYRLKHVHILGFLNQSEMPLAYVLGEILCLISDPTETWGLVVNEALACGRPVIVSDTVGCSPDLVGVENGWVTPVDDHDQLTRILHQAFVQHADWNKMGEIGRTKVFNNSFSKMASGVISAVESLQVG